jgi:hypothetical protein
MLLTPAGATIKRLEREISVSEQGYLELLHGLNLAKLKLQDNEMSSNLKAIDLHFILYRPTLLKELYYYCSFYRRDPHISNYSSDGIF